MLFKKIGLIDENFDFRENMYVGTEGEKITYISELAPEDEARFGEIFEEKNKVLMPGFYNAHGHSPMCLMRGYGENLKLIDWLETLIFPFEDQLYDEGIFWSTTLSMAESLRFGIVSTSDMYFYIDAMYDAILQSGTKSNLSRSVANPIKLPVNENQGFREMLDSIVKYKGINDRIIMEACPHAEYTNDDAMIRAIADAAKEYDVRVHVHVSETEGETKDCIERHGMTPVEYFAHNGLFDQPTNAAHCVWLTDNDRAILKEKKVSVSNNPISNLKLVSGICDVSKLYDAGINVAIGTDGSASNNSLNFFESIKSFALLGKYSAADPARMTSAQVLHSATRSGAIAQGRDDCGLVKEGFKADLIVVDLNQPNMQPIHNTMNNLVYSADGKDVYLTMVDGKVLYKNGEYTTIDVEKAIFETDRARRTMLANLDK